MSSSAAPPNAGGGEHERRMTSMNSMWAISANGARLVTQQPFEWVSLSLSALLQLPGL